MNTNRLISCGFWLYAALFSMLSVPLRAELANVAPDGIAYTSGALYGTYKIEFLNDGNRSQELHAAAAPQAPFFYSLDLGKDLTIRKFAIYPRQDGCCPERLRNFHLSLHSDNNGAVGTEIWGTNVLTGAGENAGSGAGKVLNVDVPGDQIGRWVKVESLDVPLQDYTLQMTELEVYADLPPSEINRAVNAEVTANGPLYPGFNLSSIVDGARLTFVHGDTALPTGFSYTINLRTLVKLSAIRIWARPDSCCPDRLANYKVSVLTDDNGVPGSAVWSADLHTDSTNTGPGPGARDELLAAADPAGNFQGQYIVIQSLDDPVPNYALQIAEVEALGESFGSTSVVITQQPSDVATAVARSAQLTIVATVVNGDPAKLTYQWQKNGANIAGATTATYDTPPSLLTDDKAKFKCVVSYPGLPDVTSDEATLRLNLAFQSAAYSNRPLWANGGWNISMIVNGSRTDVLHGDTPIEPGFHYQIDLGASVKIEEIRIYPRQDGCCPERLRNIRVSVHTNNLAEIGDSLWSADLYTDGSNAGSGPGLVTIVTPELDPAGKFEGQWIEIANLEDPVTPYALQMTEVEVYGQFAAGTASISFVQQPSVLSQVPGRPTTFTTVAKVVNGDIDKLGYKWTRDGNVIPGATASTYTTPPVVDADTNAVFRCVLTYPGVVDVVSDPVQIVFDYNYAKGQPAFSNRPLWAPGNWNISQIVDGNLLNLVHGDTGIAPGYAYWVNLGVDVAVDHINIYPRQDTCCAQRLSNFRVSLHQDSNGELGDETWGGDFFTEGGNAGQGPGAVFTIFAGDGAGDFQGYWLRILALGDPVPDYHLQLTEIEVFGLPKTGPVGPVLSFQLKPTGLELSWTTGILQSADSLTGAWTAVNNATSPYLVVPVGPPKFFRLLVP